MTELRATYRLQLTPGFGFDKAAEVADYLKQLGVSHIYFSPCFQAAPGSTHGYDVVNYHRVSDDLGGPEAHARMCERLRRVGLGQILDIVPNHMAITGPENPWWWDVLENGHSSKYALYFDVDWHSPEERLRNTILAPVLEDQYGRVLESGLIRLARNGGTFTIHYRDRVFPVAPRSLAPIFAAAAERCSSDDLAFLADALDWLPLPTSIDYASLKRRHRDKAVLGRQIARLFAEDAAVARAVDEVIERINADPDSLDALLERQNYRLAFWRTAERELGYRRFFDINSLVGLRMEDETVFNDTHAVVLGWLKQGLLDGVRIDHVDGLRDPECYLGRVRESSPGSYLVVEKILMAGERLRENWPVDGTTGYDFANRVMGLFVDRAGERPLTDFYARFTGETTDYAALAREKKLQLMRGALGSDLSRLTALFLEVCERHRNHRDHTRHAVHEALLEVIASFTVYRTYVSAERSRITVDDVQALDKAIADARRIRPDLDAGLLDFLRDVLTLHVRGELETELVMRFQQVTGPVMAKAIEDTALYCFNRLTCLNEVGGDPSRFGVSPDEMFTETAESHAHWPRTMLALSTHDSKRSADVRARLCLLSEIPERWSDAVRRFAAVNDRHRRNGLPDRHAEYLLYQTLVGAWPIETARVTAYMIKAAREAKMRTSWTNPDEQYEEALRGFIQSALADESFVAHLTAFVAPLIEPGRVNSLAQTLIQLTAPGVPDLYQGSELWDLSLVDPDNRRPVDFALRRRLLGELKTAGVADVMRRSDEGLPKLWLITKTLALRKRNPALFAPDSSFVPLRADGARHDHVVAFARKGDAVTVVPRLVMKLGGGWQDTTLELPRGTWRNELTGAQHREGRFALGELLAEFPVALLVSQDGAR